MLGPHCQVIVTAHSVSVSLRCKMMQSRRKVAFLIGKFHCALFFFVRPAGVPMLAN